MKGTDGYSVLVCDWDGTLVDTMPGKIRNAACVFHDLYGVDEKIVELAYREYSGVPRRELFDSIACRSLGRRLSGGEYQEASERFTTLNVLEQPASFRGVRSTLQALSADGIPVIVSSSAVEEELLPRVRSSGLRVYIRLVYGSRAGFGKGPDHIRAIRREYQIAKSKKILFVGDEVKDVELALLAGVTAGAVTNSVTRKGLLDSGAEHVFDDFREVLPLFGIRPSHRR